MSECGGEGGIVIPKDELDKEARRASEVDWMGREKADVAPAEARPTELLPQLRSLATCMHPRRLNLSGIDSNRPVVISIYYLFFMKRSFFCSFYSFYIL